jgi:hypothetical protein
VAAASTLLGEPTTHAAMKSNPVLLTLSRAQMRAGWGRLVNKFGDDTPAMVVADAGVLLTGVSPWHFNLRIESDRDLHRCNKVG